MGTLGLLLGVSALFGTASKPVAAQDAEVPEAPEVSPPPEAPAETTAETPVPSPAETKLPESAAARTEVVTPPITQMEPAPVVVEEPVAAAPEEPEEPEAEPEPEASVKLGGYAEAYYSRNFNRPNNGITNNRWIDEKDNSFTLGIVALEIAAEKGPFTANATLMFGPSADRWYFEGVRPPESEEDVVLSPAGYNNETWKHIQSAYVGYLAPIGDGLLIQGGLFPTQVGYEGVAVRDNWNWSRSNLFNFLPFFHVGARVSYPISEELTVTGAVYNGVNQATDLNGSKSVSVQASYVKGDLLTNVLYLGGNERPRGDAGGYAWRNLFDLVMQYDVNQHLSLAMHADSGFEESNLGKHRWVAAAFYARVKALDWLYFAARGDGIFESVPNKDPANSILILGADRMVSATGTVEFRPVGDGFSLRLEYRHDNSDKDSPMYFTRGFSADGSQKLSATQNTFTVGMTAWF